MKLEKYTVKELIQSKSTRVTFEKPSKGCSSKVWEQFIIVKVDNKVCNYVYYKCGEILKWKSRDGTSGLQYHVSSACNLAASSSKSTKITDLPKFNLSKAKLTVPAKVKSQTADCIAKMCAKDIRYVANILMMLFI